MSDDQQIANLLKSIEKKLILILYVLVFGLAIGLNAGYRAGAFGWILSS